MLPIATDRLTFALFGGKFLTFLVSFYGQISPQYVRKLSIELFHLALIPPFQLWLGIGIGLPEQIRLTIVKLMVKMQMLSMMIMNLGHCTDRDGAYKRPSLRRQCPYQWYDDNILHACRCLYLNMPVLHNTCVYMLMPVCVNVYACMCTCAFMCMFVLKRL